MAQPRPCAQHPPHTVCKCKRPQGPRTCAQCRLYAPHGCRQGELITNNIVNVCLAMLDTQDVSAPDKTCAAGRPGTRLPTLYSQTCQSRHA